MRIIPRPKSDAGAFLCGVILFLLSMTLCGGAVAAFIGVVVGVEITFPFP